MGIVTKSLASLAGLAILAVAGVALIVPAKVESDRNPVEPHAPYPVSEAARTLHGNLTVADWHADSLLWKRDLTERGDRGQVDFPRLREGGSAIQVFTAVTKSPAGQNYDENETGAMDNITLLAIASLWPVRTWQDLTERALYQAEKLHDFAADDGNVAIIRTRADLDTALDAHRADPNALGAVLGIEGSHALEGDLANLDRLEAAGYRVIGLHHFFDNALGGSLHGTSNAGLTDFGRAVVREVAERGMVLDLAHSSPQVVSDTLDMVEMPVIVSHGGLHSFCPVKRNLPDELMLRVAETGGVVGMGYWGDVTCGDVTPAGIAAMIAQAVEVLGEDHVSLGSDYDGSVGTGFDTSELPALTQALMDKGLSDAQIGKVMGGNIVRVLSDRLR
ncbi:peptidase M19 [Oceanicola sp. 22II-s10i]|uniref:dipeptidase n=1 Tax=Oceanicola sp. 22II-s10i TaxID=1317116 RepID=UPI000B523684|nr:membrane dipeptidase [Oceanicola sp. 22II-s10i]OWU84281.1 peptidase M19 [Oceanicola sp. 22II-s10i]